MWVRLPPDARALWGLVPLLTGHRRTLCRRGPDAVNSAGCLHGPELAERAAGTGVCSQSTPASPPAPPPASRSLAAAPPASPGSSAKLFNAVISRQGESSVPGPRCSSGRAGVERTEGARRGGTSEGLSETRSQASFQQAGCPREARARPSPRSARPHTFLSHRERRVGRKEAIYPPPAPHPQSPALLSGPEPPSDELTHSHPHLRGSPA